MTPYQQTLMDYISVLQFHSSSGEFILQCLQDKCAQHTDSEKYTDNFLFWKKLLNTFLTNSHVVLYGNIKDEEVQIRRNPYRIERLTTLKYKKHNETSLWFMNVPKMKHYIYQILKDRQEYKKIREDILHMDDREERAKLLKTTAPKLFDTQHSLYPYMTGYVKSESKTDYFKFIPLLMWTLENLFYYDKYSSECNPFIEKVVIPLLRLHKQYTDDFLVMAYQEADLFDKSLQFDQRISFNKNKPLDTEDLSTYCSFANELKSAIVNNKYTVLNRKIVKNLKTYNLLYTIFCIEHWVETHDITDYHHIIDNVDLDRALTIINYMSQVFSAENLKAQLINRIYSLSTKPEFYDYNVLDEVYTEVSETLENLGFIGLLSSADLQDVHKEIDRPLQMRRETILNAKQT